MTELVIGNTNYSSWSLRAWLCMRASGIPFRLRVIQLDVESTPREMALHSPTGKVPVLKVAASPESFVVFDSLAIAEYAAEANRDLWPGFPDLRAQARSVTCEMHSGFSALRQEMPMNVRRQTPPPGREYSEACKDQIKRIDTIWSECLERSGGPFLFGRWSIADCFFAPVVFRFRTYGVEMMSPNKEYTERVLASPHIKEWEEMVAKEPWVIAHEEV